VNAGTDAGVLVAGGGIVGLTAACLLADAGFQICVIDPNADVAAPSGDYDLRTYSVTPASARVLDASGAWAMLDHERVAEFRSMEVWDAGSSGRIRFDADGVHDAVLGYIIEHDNLLHALQEAVRRRGAVERRATSIRDIDFEDRPMTVYLGTGRPIGAKMIVAADGANSRVRELTGVVTTRHDYRQHAVVCNVTTSRPHGAVARQLFLPEGPLAFLPLADPSRCSIVWSTTPELARHLCDCGDEEFREGLSEAFEYTLGRIDGAGRRAGYALRRLHAMAYTGPGFALIGDAAHVVHPLAGQGLNLGIMDAAVLAEVLGEDRAGNSAFSRRALRRYERWRRSENTAMLSVCGALNCLFREAHPFVKWLRGTGLNATDASGPVKRWLAARAAGSIGDQPKAARGRGFL
jgi:2-octaprenylphenol hydroxylase